MNKEILTKDDVDSAIRDLEDAMSEVAEKYERLIEQQGSFANEEIKDVIALGFTVGQSFKFICPTIKDHDGDTLTVTGYEISSHIKVKFSSKFKPETTNLGFLYESIKKYPERLIKQQQKQEVK